MHVTRPQFFFRWVWLKIKEPGLCLARVLFWNRFWSHSHMFVTQKRHTPKPGCVKARGLLLKPSHRTSWRRNCAEKPKSGSNPTLTWSCELDERSITGMSKRHRQRPQSSNPQALIGEREQPPSPRPREAARRRHGPPF